MIWAILFIFLLLWVGVVMPWARRSNEEYETNRLNYRYECYACGTFTNNANALCDTCQPRE